MGGKRGCPASLLSEGWQFLTLPADAATTPAALPANAPWMPAIVPGTVAPEPNRDLTKFDHWYRLDRVFPPNAALVFHGMAGDAEIWLDGELSATIETMFRPMEIEVPAKGACRLEIRFRASSSRPSRRPSSRRRARWLGRLTTNESLRERRTSLLGHMPSWAGAMPIIGPYRPVFLRNPASGAPAIRRVDLRTGLEVDGTGVIELRLEGTGLAARHARLRAGGHDAPLSPDGAGLHGRLTIPNPPLWWPHTHGEPNTCAVSVEIDGHAIDLGKAGFVRIETRHSEAGFGLIVNGVPVFCRGTVWVGLDTTGAPPSADALAASLQHAREAGFNMLRVSGMTLYESPEFFDMCDALGLMVWHDFMFARFDYPDDPAFLAEVRGEARAFLETAQAHPSLAVLCGGTEVVQAAAMAGCAPQMWSIPLFEQVLADEARAARPNIPYLPNAPWGPTERGLPFAASAPVAHYFGVGGYLRPLQDLTEAGVRFAAECLAFANPPDPAACRALGDAPGVDEAWHRAVVRDPGASWTFEDVRDHYVETLFGVSAAAIRRRAPLHWLDLGRAAVGIIMQQAVATWRTDARCAGALVLMHQDVRAGAGWGVIGHDGRPKSAWYALRSVCQPVQVLLRDLGQNGVALHAINETAAARRLRLGLRALAPDGAVEWLGSEVLDLAPREQRAVQATTLMGRWRDLANAWPFGPPSFTVLGATLDDAETGARLSEATYFPTGPALPRAELGLTARPQGGPGLWAIEVAARQFAQFVQFDDDEFVPTDNYFHLWPGESRVVDFRGPAAAAPCGTISALNGFAPAHYRTAA